jgi:hypothetical protein
MLPCEIGLRPWVAHYNLKGKALERAAEFDGTDGTGR